MIRRSRLAAGWRPMRIQDGAAMNGENPVVHFEMPYLDEARLTRFYQQAIFIR